MGRSPIAPEAFNCSAPDTGNMEVLARYGTDEQKSQWLTPLLEGSIRSCFAMTEPDVASSDATNIRVEDCGGMAIRTSSPDVSGGYLEPRTARCKICILMGMTNPSAPPHQRQSMILIPLDAAGVTIQRTLSVFGYDH